MGSIFHFNDLTGFMSIFLQRMTRIIYTHTREREIGAESSIWKKIMREELPVTVPSVFSSLQPPLSVLPPCLSLIPPELLFQIFYYQAQ